MPPKPDPLGFGVECPPSRVSPSFGPIEEAASPNFASAVRGVRVLDMYLGSPDGLAEGRRTRELNEDEDLQTVGGCQLTGIDWASTLLLRYRRRQVSEYHGDTLRRYGTNLSEAMARMSTATDIQEPAKKKGGR
jgi:hypothetical protein